MSWQAIGDESRTARKSHVCIWCGERIAPGEKYRLQICRFDGEFQSNKFHLDCMDAAFRLNRIEPFALEDGFEAHGFKRGSIEAR